MKVVSVKLHPLLVELCLNCCSSEDQHSFRLSLRCLHHLRITPVSADYWHSKFVNLSWQCPRAMYKWTKQEGGVQSSPMHFPSTVVSVDTLADATAMLLYRPQWLSFITESLRVYSSFVIIGNFHNKAWCFALKLVQVIVPSRMHLPWVTLYSVLVTTRTLELLAHIALLGSIHPTNCKVVGILHSCKCSNCWMPAGVGFLCMGVGGNAGVFFPWFLIIQF